MGEVTALKKRLDAMTQQIDALTAMVSKVNLKQEQQEVEETTSFLGAKRKKADFVHPGAPAMDAAQSSADIRPDDMMSNMELEEFAAMPLPDPMPLSNPEIPG